MANAGFGNLVGNFLQAFTQSKMLSQRSAADEEERKARTKLFEIQLKREQERAAAEGKVNDMMSGTPVQMPNITQGPGELEEFNIGPRTQGNTGMSLLQMLTNPDAVMALSKSGMLPQFAQMDAMGARGELASGLQSGEMGPTDPAAMGLAVRSGMPLPQMGGDPESLALMQAAGIDPASEEGRQLIASRIGGNAGNGLQEFQAQLMLLQAQQAQETLDAGRRTRTSLEASAKAATRSMLRNATEMAQINDRLEGTVMQTGLPMEELRRGVAGVAPLLEKFGFDMGATQQAVADYDRFTKLSQQMAIDLLPKLAEAGTITDTKWESLEKTIMSTGVSTQANRLVTADVLELGFEAADKLGMSVDDREMLEELAQNLRTPGGSGEGGEPKRYVWNPQTRRLEPK